MVRGVLRIVSYKWSKFKIISRKKSFFYHSSKNLPNTKKSANFLNIYKLINLYLYQNLILVNLSKIIYLPRNILKHY